MSDSTSLPTSPIPSRGFKPRVVIIDDDTQILGGLQLVLNRSYEVHTSDNPTLGVELALRVDPDLVVVDIKMPDHDGFWVFSQIRARNLRVPIIFNSAHQDLMEAGSVELAFKPYAYLNKGSVRELMSKVSEAVSWYTAVRSR